MAAVSQLGWVSCSCKLQKGLGVAPASRSVPQLGVKPTFPHWARPALSEYEYMGDARAEAGEGFFRGEMVPEGFF